MRSVDIPQLVFTPWFKWEDRNTVEDADYPGVYLIAITEKQLEGKEPDYGDVSYIGMTNSRAGLKGRWQQFFNSIRGKHGHSGGNTVFSQLGHYDNWTESLYVAAMPVRCDVTSPEQADLLSMGCVAFLEYEAFSRFYVLYPDQGKPRFNTR